MVLMRSGVLWLFLIILIRKKEKKTCPRDTCRMLPPRPLASPRASPAEPFEPAPFASPRASRLPRRHDCLLSPPCRLLPAFLPPDCSALPHHVLSLTSALPACPPLALSPSLFVPPPPRRRLRSCPPLDPPPASVPASSLHAACNMLTQKGWYLPSQDALCLFGAVG